jgi:GNAT superfamily N-acetyltransferase
VVHPPSIHRRLGGLDLAQVCLEEDLDVPDGWIVTWVFVPPSHRGVGLGREMMRELCEWADRESQTLSLGVCGDGGLSNEELREWYRRCGFVGDDNYLCMMERRPGWASA